MEVRGGFVQLYASNSPANVTDYTKVGQYFYTSTAAKYASTMTRKASKNDCQIFVKEYQVKDGSIVIGNYESVQYSEIYPETADTSYANYYGNTYEYTISDAVVVANITLNIYPGATITNAIYGGGKNGAVKGDIEINIYEGASYNNTIYAGGEGLNENISGAIVSIPFVWTNAQDERVITKERFEAICNQPGTIYKNAPSAGNYTTPFLIKEEVMNKLKQSDGKVYIYSSSIEKLGLIDGNTTVNMNGTKTGDIYGGSNGKVARVNGDTNINIYSGTTGAIYGGGNAGEVINSTIFVTGNATSTTIYGGGNLASILGNSNITIDRAKVTTLYGGGNQGAVLGDVTIDITRGTITNIYGGGNYGTVNGSASTTVNSGTITTMYGGGNNGEILEDSEIIINQGTIATAFGGGHLGLVHGNTNVVVGNSTNPYVTITNVLYGGGEGPGNDATYETVVGDATVLIEGLNTNVENYGSALLGKVDGDVNVTFRDYWTGNATDKYKTMNGIDRATNVYFDNSFVLLENKAANGDLEGIKDITNLWIPDGSGLKVSATGELLGDFHGGGNFYLDSEVCLTINGDIYGETLLVLNPLLVEDINLIKGGINNPYMRILGNDHSNNSTALYSTDERYTIMHSTDGSGAGIYYIPRDVIINDKIENVVTNAIGSVYTSDVSTWGIQDIHIRDAGKFTANVAITINYQVPKGESFYENITRGIGLLSRDTRANFPVGTILTIYSNGTLYSYRVISPTLEVKIADFISTGGSSNAFQEVNNVLANSEVVGENELQGTSYGYNENYRIIVDFSEVESENLLARGPYNFIMNFYDNNVAMNEMQAKATNVVRIEETRKYTAEIINNFEGFEPDSAFRFSNRIASLEDVLSDELYGNSIYAVVSFLDLDNNLISLDENAEVRVDSQMATHTNASFKYKALDDLEMEAFDNTSNIVVDLSHIALNNRLLEGNYKINVKYYIGDSNQVFLRQIAEVEKEILVKYFRYSSFLCTVSEGSSMGKNALVVSSSDSTRTINVLYEGDLDQPYVDITAYRKTGANGYSEVDNVLTAKKIPTLSESQNIAFTRVSTLPTGTYKIVFTLKDKSGREKASEALLFELQ